MFDILKEHTNAVGKWAMGKHKITSCFHLQRKYCLRCNNGKGEVH